jgi:uncharacterized protein (TIRG00374 family)
MMRPFNRVLRLVIKLIGPALLLYFLLTTDLEKLWATLLQTNLWLYALSLVLVFPFLVLKGWRWQLILNAWRIHIDLIDATALYSVGIFLGIMTPGQAGDAVKAWYLRQRGESLTAGLASVVLDRLFDVGIMGLLAASGLYFFWDVLPGGKVADVVTVVVMLLAVVVGLIFAAYRPLRTWAIHHLVPQGLARRLNLAAMEHMHLHPGQIGTIALVSVAGLTLTFVRVYLLFLALATPIALGPFVALVAIIALVGTASPGGVGTRDAVLVVILSSILAMSPTDAQARALALSALLLSLNILNAIIGYLVSLRYPLDLIRNQPVGETTA